jgi:hypothetical protein
VSGLNFPSYEFRIRNSAGGKEIFDPVRKAWTALTPEEWVRQHAAAWLQDAKGYPASLMAIEKRIKVNGLTRRCDIICHDAFAAPLVIVECKSPEVNITQELFDQAARYNLTVGAQYFLLTNGLRHFCCTMDHETQSWNFLQELPAFK